MSAILGNEQLSEILFGHQRFRLETLPHYSVGDDGVDYERFIAGAPEPTWERKRPWMDVLRADRAAGRGATRVRILSEQLTDYERYACEWGYALNAEAGEDIRVLHRGEHTIPEARFIGRDFWIVDGEQVVLMHYDAYGRFEGAELAAPAERHAFHDTRDAAWELAEPFVEWWARHPELHRNVAV
jgi:hypothetical protein